MHCDAGYDVDEKADKKNSNSPKSKLMLASTGISLNSSAASLLISCSSSLLPYPTLPYLTLLPYPTTVG